MKVANAKLRPLHELLEYMSVPIQGPFTRDNAQYTSPEFAAVDRCPDDCLSHDGLQEVIQVLADMIRGETFSMFGISGKEDKNAAPLSHAHTPLCIIADDCQDVSVTEQMALVLRGVVDGCVQERFLGLVALPDQKAVTIHRAIMDKAESLGIHPSRIVALGSDGVSTWTGEKNGVVALWKQQTASHVLHVWCVCHKLALVPKVAAASVRGVGQHFNSVLDSLYGLFCQSSPRTALLKDIQEAMEDPLLKVARSSETRWVSRDKVTETIYRTLPALISFLIMDAYNPTCSDKAKVPGLRDALMDWDFLATLSLFRDVLPIFTRVLELFQTRDMDWFEASAELPKLRIELASLKETDGHHLRQLKDYISRLEKKIKEYGQTKADEVERLLNDENVKRPPRWGSVDMEFRRFSIEQDVKVAQQWQASVRRAWIQALLDQFDARFPPDAMTSIPARLHRAFQGAFQTELASDRSSDLKAVMEHYKAFLPSGLSFDKLLQEYGTLCIHTEYQRTKLPHGARSAEYLLAWLSSATAKESHRNISLLMKISMTVPVSSAEAERVFSTMNRIKDSERASLGQAMLDNLMVISHIGPKLQDMDYARAVYLWYTKSPRREKLGDYFLTSLQTKYAGAI